jgi:cytochrome c biogenesis protein CcmG/thiol:disulfide interchange protein DsbE
MATLPSSLNYPVAVDRSGRFADGYEVQDEPWFVLTSATGRILWFWDVSTSGWLSTQRLIAKVRAGLAKAPAPSTSAAAATQALAGSPTPLAALHAQASRLLGGESALAARIRALRGYPIVINIWASWCDPCRAEFSVFASASVLYGKRVAFLGADYTDTPGSALPFLSQHRVSYPSYQAGEGQLDTLAPGGINSLPITVILNRSGSVVHTNFGPYLTQGALDQDINSYALKG